MKKIILQIHKLLIKKKKTVSVAESCTGGKLSELLTRIGGSSQYFLLGIVAYSNKAKQKILSIPKSVLLEDGPVSSKTTSLLAYKVRKLVNADIGVAITGIAGPTGGTSKTPTGTVFIALDTAKKRFSKRLLFKGNRSLIRDKAAIYALKLIKKALK